MAGKSLGFRMQYMHEEAVTMNCNGSCMCVGDACMQWQYSVVKWPERSKYGFCGLSYIVTWVGKDNPVCKEDKQDD